MTMLPAAASTPAASPMTIAPAEASASTALPTAITPPPPVISAALPKAIDPAVPPFATPYPIETFPIPAPDTVPSPIAILAGAVAIPPKSAAPPPEAEPHCAISKLSVTPTAKSVALPSIVVTKSAAAISVRVICPSEASPPSQEPAPVQNPPQSTLPPPSMLPSNVSSPSAKLICAVPSKIPVNAASPSIVPAPIPHIPLSIPACAGKAAPTNINPPQKKEFRK